MDNCFQNEGLYYYRGSTLVLCGVYYYFLVMNVRYMDIDIGWLVILFKCLKRQKLKIK